MQLVGRERTTAVGDESLRVKEIQTGEGVHGRDYPQPWRRDQAGTPVVSFTGTERRIIRQLGLGAHGGEEAETTMEAVPDVVVVAAVAGT